MAQTKYTYSVSTDITAQACNVGRLDKDIRDSAIVTALDYINLLGDVLDVYMKDALSTGDKTILDGLITNHTGEALPDDFVQNVALSDVAKDSEQAQLTRTKTTKTGWHYQPHWLEINTSDYDNGFYNKDKDGNDLGFVTYKIYDNTDTEITSTANEGNAVKTVVTWEPDHDYEIIASKVFQASAPGSDVRIWVEGLPDVPFASGGERMFAEGGINLKLLGSGAAADTDGRSSKLLSYSATYHTNKFEVTVRHGAGVQHTFALLWEIYKE